MYSKEDTGEDRENKMYVNIDNHENQEDTYLEQGYVVVPGARLEDMIQNRNQVDRSDIQNSHELVNLYVKLHYFLAGQNKQD